MNTLPITVQAIADTTKAARSIDNLTRKREVVLAATMDAKSIIAANKPLGAIKRSADEFEKSMQAANARVLAFGTSVAVIEGMRRSFLALIKTTADVQEALTKINIVGGEELKKVGKTLDSVGKDIFDLAKRTGQSFDVASKAFLEFTRQGLGPVETLKRTETALNVARVSGEDYASVVEGLTAAYNSFKKTGIDYTKIADKIVAVDNAAAISTGQLLDSLKRSSAVAQQAGTSLDELIATTTVLQEVTARGGGVIGNAIKSITTRIKRPDTLKYLEEIGIQTKNIDNNKLLSQIDILKNVAERLKSINDESKQLELIEKISGLYQIDQLTAFINELSAAGNEGKRFADIMKTSAEAGGQLSEASAQFSQNLVNKFVAVDVSIQQVLNSLGKIGVKNPISGLLDDVIEFGSAFSEFLDGDQVGSDFAKGIIKGIGGIIFGPTGIITVGFAVGKIILDFAKFGVSAAKSFLSLNKTAKEQELIQKSILTTISQMPSILSGIENTEAGRLLLAQRVTAEYEKQFAVQKFLNGLTSGAAKTVYSKGIRVGDTGLTKKGVGAAKGYLPDLISSEMKDIKAGVGGASPSSKVVVIPNFPFGGGKKGLMVANSSEKAVKMGDGYGILNPDMMGERSAAGFYKPSSIAAVTQSGGSASTSLIENALNNLAKSSDLFQLFTGDLAKKVKEVLKPLDLNKRSLDELTKEFIRQTDSVRKSTISINAETERRKKEIKLRLSDPNDIGVPIGKKVRTADEFALQMSSLVALDIASKRLASPSSNIYGNIGSANTSFFGGSLTGISDPFNLDASKKAFYPPARADRSELYRMSGRITAERNYAANPTAAFGGTQRLESQGILTPIGQSAEKTKKSLESFAVKAFAIGATVDFFGSQLKGTSETLDKFADAASRVTALISGFLFLNRGKGISFGSIFSGSGEKAAKEPGRISKAFGGFKQNFATAKGGGDASGLGGLLGVGVRGLPIVGQIALAGFAINEFSKVFSDKSLFDRAAQAINGVSEAGERAKEKFNEIAGELFSDGKFTGRSSENIRSNLNEARIDIQARTRAKKLGINVENKKTPEVLNEEINKLITNAISSVKTGTTKTVSFGSYREGTKETFNIEETLATFDGDVREILASTLKDTLPSPEKMKEFVSKAGNKSFDKDNLTEDEISNLIFEYNKVILTEFVKSQRDRLGNLSFKKSLASQGPEAFQAGLIDFIDKKTSFPSPRGSTNQQSNFTGPNLPTKDVLDNLAKSQSELEVLLIDGLISSLESKVKGLEFSASGNVSEAEKNSFLSKADKISRQILQKRLDKLNKEFQSEAAQARTGKSAEGKSPIEIQKDVEVISQKYKNQRSEIEESIKALNRETNAREQSFKTFQRLNPVISNLERFLSRSAIARAKSESELGLIQARGGNPSLSISAQRDFQRQEAAKQIELLQRDLSDAEARKKIDLANAELLGDPQKIKDEQSKIKDAFKAQKTSINGQIAAINETTSQIGSVKSSFVSLNDAILQFTEGLGESRGQNQFNLLQATDASSIVQGLIGERVYGNAAGRSGQDLVSFIADQNTLLNEQFKIKTSSNASEKLELERQLELTTQILEIKNKNLDPAQKQLELEKAINDNLAKRRTFGAGVEDATAGMRTSIQTFNSDFGRTATEGFRDALSGAIKAAVSETDNLKNALLDVALQFANSLRDKAIDNLSNVITNSLFGGGKSSGSSTGNVIGGILGGLFGAKATGGLITGGSGSKDDVPTLLMGGEYVINKKAVQSYGKSFFDSLNSGSVGKMAQGGYFAPGVRGQGTIRGKENLLDFATQTATSGKKDIISQLAGGAAIVSLEPESLRLSNFARFGDSPIIQATQEAKDQAFGLYLDQLGAEKDYERQLEEIKKAEKEKKKQFWISLATAVIGAGLSYGANSLGGVSSASKAATAGSQRYYNSSGQLVKALGSSLNSGSSGYGIPFRNAPSFSGGNQTLSSANLLNIGSDIMGIYSGFSNNRMINRSPFSPYGGYGYENPLFSGINVNGRRYNSGGKVSGSGDTVPAMLSNKEFVLNSSAAKKIGDKNLYALNNGLIPSGQNSQESESRIIAKLDELIEKTLGASNISITVNAEQSKENSSSGEQGDTQNNQRQLAQKIRETVVGVIREEQRPGGLLTSTRR